MKKSIKFICLLLAASMLAGLATGCTSEPKDLNNGGGTADPTPAGSGKTPLSELTLPLTDDPNAELSVFIPFFDAGVDLNESENIKYLEEVTGVKVNWITVSDADMAQRWQLLPVSNNLPDIMISMAGFNADAAIEDGWMIDMSELIELYMPNLRKYLSDHERVRKASESPDGKIKKSATFFGDDYGPKREWATMGMCIREDLIQQAGYTGPLETVSDYYDMLTTVKRHFPDMTSPLYTNFGFVWLSSFLSAFGAFPENYLDNGVIKFGPAEPGYGAWLEEMRKWYAEGLIEPNFDSVGLMDGLQAPGTIISTDNSVLFSGVYSRIGTVLPIAFGLTENPNVRIAPVKLPVMNRGDRPVNIWGEESDWTLNGYSHISPDCKNPELAAKWLDFMLTEDAMRILYYGQEGVHHTVDNSPDATFKYVYTEAYDTPDKRKGKISSPSIGWYNWAAGYQSIKLDIDNTIVSLGIDSDDSFDTALAAINLWSDIDNHSGLNTMRNLTLTDEEQREVSTIGTDIATYASEYMVQYIKGLIDQSFDSFVNVLRNDLQLDKYIEVYQQAYDRSVR